MRVLRFAVRDFGRLERLEAGAGTPLPGFVVFHGHNESGKSTLREALIATYYGFYPASRDTHPLAPWGGGTPELTATIELSESGNASGGAIEVERRLLTRPSATLVRGSVAEDLRNGALPPFRRLHQNVYRQLYAPEASEMARLRSEAWEAARERMVVGMGTSDLRSPEAAANELAAEAAVLWRPDRRGSPRAAELQGELEALREGRRQALARDAALRELHLREAEGSTRLAALRGRRTTVRERRDEAMRRETLRGEQEARVRSLREELERVRGQPNDAPGRAPGSGLLAFASGGVLAALSLADLLMGGGIGLRSVGGGLLGALLLALGTAGLARWRERSRASSRARQAQEEEIARLERSLEEVEAASPGPTGAGHAVDEAESLADDLAALDREIEELLQALERGRQEASYLEGRETPDLVDGRILAVEEELQEVRRRRDRIFLLSRLIRLAERRFREAHQPDLIRRAGRHLGRITGGRYAQFLLSDATDDDPLRLRGGDVERPLPISPPLSTGTREQAYLALRLAIVDHLDDGHEPLPLILDEVFANWDPPRRGRALDLLVAISASRQVFLLTCDPATAAAAAKRGGEVLSLEPHSPMEPDTR